MRAIFSCKRGARILFFSRGTHLFFMNQAKALACIYNMEEKKKTIRVVAAIITDGERILATQRGYGAFQGMWEFPGGKIEPGEEPVQALRREIMEELQLEIDILRFVSIVDYEYPDFILNMDCYLCNIVGGNMNLTEHLAAKWLTLDELTSVEWLPADVELVEQLRQTMK